MYLRASDDKLVVLSVVSHSATVELTANGVQLDLQRGWHNVRCRLRAQESFLTLPLCQAWVTFRILPPRAKRGQYYAVVCRVEGRIDCTKYIFYIPKAYVVYTILYSLAVGM